MLGDGVTDTMTVTIRKATYALGTEVANPTYAAFDTIAVSAAEGARDGTITGSITAGDVLEFTVTSAPASAVNATVSLILNATG